MPRKRNPIPKLCRHKATDRAYARVDGRHVYFGKWGTDDAVEQYRRLVAEHASGTNTSANGSRRDEVVDDLTVAGLVVRYWRFIEHSGRYTKNGEPTSERERVRGALDELLALYASVPVVEFGPRKLVALREAMAEGPSGRARSRVTVNGQVSRVRRLFRWGVERELVPPTVAHGLACVAGIRRGETSTLAETAPVRPVDSTVAEKAADAAPPTIAAMIRLQLSTGMRPGEVCILRTADVDQTGDVWIYKPSSHKTEAHGVERAIPIGPAGQRVLAPLLRPDAPDAFVFSPGRAEEERHAEQRRQAMARYGDRGRPNRSRDEERRQKPMVTLSERYDSSSYRKAIAHACRAAGVEPFGPNRLRHTALTEARRRAGLDAAQVLGGHTDAKTTQRYAEVLPAAAIQYARRHG
ncbi:MAG: site-specific integrase [bacterium]|nr:site-specific integrase [bacterium]